MLHDIAPDVYNNDFALPFPDLQDKVVFFRGKSVLVHIEKGGLHKADDPCEAELRAPSFSDLGINGEEHYQCRYLFSVGKQRYFFCNLSDSAIDELSEEPGWEFIALQELQNYQPKPVRFALTVAYEYWTWYESAQFCGRCGAHNIPDKNERMMRCPECGLMTFPKVFPAVIVGITRSDGKVLITRYAGRPYSRNALVAGFCEMGETVEQTVHREVMEEVGLRVKNLRYYKSQPWPDSSSLLFGFFCELDGTSEIKLDENELSMAQWVERSELYEDNDHSLTREMMGVMREGRETEFCVVAQ